jgi:hypothetical protein
MKNHFYIIIKKMKEKKITFKKKIKINNDFFFNIF